MDAPRVNASMMKQYSGRLVCFVGSVSEINSTGTELKMLSSDDKMIHVVLPEPLDEALQGVVEVVGRVERDLTISAQRIISYAGREEFDLSLYNEAITLAAGFPEMFACEQSSGY
ncbi:predicted protein [Nematostella vectensis]|uniref:Replication protein A 14 kDa subunit n=1 Tax=Nematostella vectensis TaxID=45351 RepID=A7RHZ6_NEMVE|nr:replication protein A 14 kDa subunit [Nematostella vectensis]EDO49061.1 predicted protein [Nematostella vectensis]|eukprot:XP_001641124.1 predicted protein [Nematostella vectensis]